MPDIVNLKRAGGIPAYFAVRFEGSADEMWRQLHDALAAIAGIDAVFYLAYPFGDTAGNLAQVMERGVWKMSYPEAYVAALTGNALSNDRSSQVVLKTRQPCFWHHPETWEGATPGQKARAALDHAMGMAVGLCIPLLSPTGRLVGGFGLRHGEQDGASFDAAVQENMDGLIDLLHRFDDAFRGPYAREVFPLTQQEGRVLACAAGGRSVVQTADDLGLSPKTVEAYLRSARARTHSANTAEAVAKALFFGLV